MVEPEEIKRNKLFKVPGVSGKAGKLSVIGVIDASGSMQGHWPHVAKLWNEKIPKENLFLTITFDNKARICKSNVLESNMNSHGGGGTNIPKAFIALEEEMSKVPLGNQITVIFISDGEDNEINTLEARMKKLKGNMGRTINFICLGIQGGFPTFLAMQLRQLYHNGFDSIPALYLVEYSSEKAFFNKFESMKEYFQSCSSLDILPPCKLYPWAEEKVDQYEGTWILTDGDYVVINDKQFEINEKSINIQDLVDIFRGWLQNLHLMALDDPKNSMKCAQMTLKEIDSQLETYKKNHGLDLKINLKEDTQNLSLYDKAFQNFMKNYGQRIVWFYKEIESIAKGEIQQNLDQFEIAKKIQLGTITGKHMQKVLALRNITSDEFIKFVTEFEEIYKNLFQNKLEELKKNEGKIPNEYIQFKDQRQIFEEPNFFACLKFFKSQYDAFDSFPIIGIPLLVKRPEGSDNDPWKIYVKAIIKNQNVVDSTYLIEKQMRIQIEKQQINQQQEEVKANENVDDTSEITGLVPLFSPKDKDLQPLLQSRFFKLMISYLVSVNADAYYSQAYLALLGSTLLNVITNETKGDFKGKILEDIISTIDLVYSTDPEFLEYQKKLINDPASVLAQEKVPSQLEKALVYLFYFYYTKTITSEEIQKIFFNIVIEWFSKLFTQNKKEYANFIQLAFQKGNIVDHFKEVLPNYQSISHFKKTFKADVIKFLAEQKIENIMFNEAVFKNVTFSNVKLETLQAISSIILGKTLASNDFIRFVYHVSANKDKRFSEPIIQDIEEIRKFSVSQYKQNYFTRNAMVKDAFYDLKQLYLKQFSENHFDVTPFTKELLEQKCQSLGIDFNSLEINAESKLLSNACCSEKCKFFLKAMEKGKIKQHLDSWVELLPQGFHKTISQNQSLNSTEIYQIFVKQGFKPEKYHVTEEFTQNYIKKVQESYVSLKKN